MSKSLELSKLYEDYKKEFAGNEIVLGDGNINAELLLIGEAPGKDEVKQLKPFVGMAGKNLTEFLSIIGIERETIFITNAIKYRLSKENPETGRIVNRPAAKDEIEVNRKCLLEEIKIISPKYIVTLGNVPLKSVLGNYNVTIGDYHGEIKNINISHKECSLFALYHPASIIYNRNLKEVYLSDLNKLKAIISK